MQRVHSAFAKECIERRNEYEKKIGYIQKTQSRLDHRRCGVKSYRSAVYLCRFGVDRSVQRQENETDSFIRFGGNRLQRNDFRAHFTDIVCVRHGICCIIVL